MVNFFAFLKQSAEEFNLLPLTTIRLVSHLDADGIAAAAIFIGAMNNCKREVQVSIIPQLDDKTLKNLAKEEQDVYVFTDLGSSSVKLLEENFQNRTVFVLDHHSVERQSKIKNIHIINPILFDLTGDEISGSGVTYLFCKELDSANKQFAHIAMIGAIGDIQEGPNGMYGLNKQILNEAKHEGLIEIEKSIRAFGLETKPLYKVLQFATDLNIPNVLNSESGSIQFLKDIGIEPTENGKWRYYRNLNNTEKERLITGIIMRCNKQSSSKQLLSWNYTLPNEKPGTPFRNLREFSTLLNSCGRLEYSSLGIGACLNDENLKRKAVKLQIEYKTKLVEGLKWIEENKNNKDIRKEGKGRKEGKEWKEWKGITIIDVGKNIYPNMIGTIISIMGNSHEFPNGHILVGMAEKDDGTIKISSRIVGKDSKINLTILLGKVIDKIGGSTGGHRNAAGAIIPKEKKKEFISLLVEPHL